MSINAKTPVGNREFYMRKRSAADRGVYNQIFIQKDYDLTPFRRGDRLREFPARIAPTRPLIIDCGANVGASAVWFATHFPEAKVVAIEPDLGNMELLRRNCAGLNVDPVAGAVSAIAETLELFDPGVGEWGYRTRAVSPDAPGLQGGYRVQAFPIDHFVRQYRNYAPFIVKIDIEGGERTLFSQDTGWIDLFPLLIIELHDRIFPECANSASFLRAIAARDRDFLYRSQNIFSIRNPI